MHTYRNWVDENQEPIKIDRGYFIRHFELVKGLVWRHYPKAASQPEKPKRANVAAPGPTPYGGQKPSGKSDKPGGKDAGKGKAGQCTKCKDGKPHKSEDCPHSGNNKGLNCKECGGVSHDSAACWQKHPELKLSRPKGKGKGKGGDKKGKSGDPNKSKPSGKGVAPAGGAPARWG
jgi:hypothetical protein